MCPRALESKTFHGSEVGEVRFSMNKLLPLGTEITFTIGRLIFVQNSLELRAQALTHPPPSPLCLSSGALVSLSPALGFSLSRKLEGAEKRFNH